MKKHTKIYFILFLSIASFFAAQLPTLEFKDGAGNPSGNGATQNTSIKFQLNSNNPSGNTFSSTPNITANFALSNQQLPNVAGVYPSVQLGSFIAESDTAPLGGPIFSPLNGYGSPVNSSYTAANGASAGTGIDVSVNHGVSLMAYPYQLYVNNSSFYGRNHVADLTITFSQPVKDPVLHFVGQGAHKEAFTWFYTSEFDIDFAASPNVTSLSRLSGTSDFNVTASQINKSSSFSNIVGGGSVALVGNNITTVKLKIYLRGSQSGSNNVLNWYDSRGKFFMAEGVNISVSMKTQIDAVNDTATINSGSTGTLSVLNNDSVNGIGATLSNIALTQVSTTNSGVNLNPATGLVSVAAGTAPGTYTINYQICDSISPGICDTATVTVTVASVDAVNDTFNPVAAGSTTTSLVANDKNIAGGQAVIGTSAGQVSIATSGTWPAGFTLNTTTGVITIGASVAAGTYTMNYTICNQTAGTPCDTAQVTIRIPVSTPCDPIVWYQTSDNKLAFANLANGISNVVCSNFQTGLGAYTDIAFAPDKTTLYAVSYDPNKIFKVNTLNCTTTTFNSSSASLSYANSLTFLPDGTALMGVAGSRDIYRVTLNTATNTYTTSLWFTIPNENNVSQPAGDFILLGDKVYCAMTTNASSSFMNWIYEVKINPSNYTPISGNTTASITGKYEGVGVSYMYGMAGIYGKLYGGFGFGVDAVKEITLGTNTFSVSNNLLANNASINGMTSTLEALGHVTPVISISAGTSSATLCTGTSVVITSNVSSGNQWYKNGIAIPGATGTTYTATSAGTYTARVEYAPTCFTPDSNLITVTVKDCIDAVDNTYTNVTAGSTLATVITNDTFNGSAANIGTTAGTVKIRTATDATGTTGAWPAGFTLNTTTGAINVGAGVTAGTYTLYYVICNQAGDVCDPAIATISVAANLLDAVADNYSAIKSGTAYTTPTSVIVNDINNAGTAAAIGNAAGQVSIASATDVAGTSGAWPAGFTLNSNGTITIASTVAGGTYTLYYTICNQTTGAPCDTAPVSITVVSIDAVNDIQTITVGTTGTISVLNNDPLNVSAANLSNVNLTQTNTTNPGVTLNPSTGFITIASGTPMGTYVVTYQICDKANPTICDTATVQVSVSVPAGTPFSCPGSNDLYLSQGPSTSVGTQFQFIGRNSNPFNYINIGNTAHGITYNAIGYNQVDNFIYGINQSGSNSDQLIRIDSAGEVVNEGSITGLPLGNYISGDMIGGDLYVMPAGNGSTLYKINVASRSVIGTITLSSPVNTSDIAHRAINGLFFGVNAEIGANQGRMFTINPTTGQVAYIGGTNTTAYRFGAMYADIFGNVYGNENTGGFYQFDLSNGFRTLLSGSPSAFVNDGAVCTNITFTLGADLQVNKTSSTTTYAPGSTVVYTIVARNNGPFGVANASVVDNMPAGIPAANVSYTAVASAGSSTNVVGTRTGAIADLVNLPINGTVTYTVTIQVPFTFTGNLVNTVTIVSPNNSTDPKPSNNSSIYTHTQSACYENPGSGSTGVPVKHGITLLGRAGSDNGNWPMLRNSAHTALESKTKGFVITRMTSDPAQLAAANHLNRITNPVVGMMVFDVFADGGKGCLKIYTGAGAGEGWKCFTTQTCP